MKDGRPEANLEHRRSNRASRSEFDRRRLISLPEAADMLGLSVASVRRLIGSGRLHAVKLNRRVLVDLRDVDRLIEEAKDRRGW
jgi:excisionase family DNA binding protein